MEDSKDDDELERGAARRTSASAEQRCVSQRSRGRVVAPVLELGVDRPTGGGSGGDEEEAELLVELRTAKGTRPGAGEDGCRGGS
jgi:hypothetical protein